MFEDISKAVLGNLRMDRQHRTSVRAWDRLVLPFQCLRQKRLALRPASVSLLLGLATQMLFCKVGRESVCPLGLPSVAGSQLGGGADVPSAFVMEVS